MSPQEEMLGMNDLMPGMKIEITVGQFHYVHEMAAASRGIVRKAALHALSRTELVIHHERLKAGQHLSDNEDNEVFEDVPCYRDSIDLVEAELKNRNI